MLPLLALRFTDHQDITELWLLLLKSRKSGSRESLLPDIDTVSSSATSLAILPSRSAGHDWQQAWEAEEPHRAHTVSAKHPLPRATRITSQVHGKALSQPWSS